jgi:hypothetical protein
MKAIDSATGLRLALAAACSLSANPAAAHGAGRGFVLLLPTGYYLVAGTAAVAASFLLLAFVQPSLIGRVARARMPIAAVPAISPVPTSLAAFIVLCILLLSGLYGSRDPLANALPLTVWTLWWVAVTLLHAALGNLWAYINPWTGPYRLLSRVAGRYGAYRPLRYPAWLGYWPAFAFFLGFAWLELVYPAPDDPLTLAWAVAAYWLAAFVGIVVFGEQAWTRHAEPFSIIFRLVAGLSPLAVQNDPTSQGRGRRMALAFPGALLLDRDPLPISGVLFVLLTLSSVSFDGLSKTFWWLALGDINPLEFPGRSAVVGRNSLGLLLAVAALGVCYVAAIWLGCRLGGRTDLRTPALGAFVYSIVPIAIAFHFSHYLPALLVDAQYAAIAASDPFATGLDLFGLGELHVTTSFLNTYAGVRAIWNVQTAAIVIGHVLAVAVAHVLALRHFGTHRAAVASEAPLAVLMVIYTVFGLWLLSTPVVG